MKSLFYQINLTKKSLLSLCQIPRASGQSRAIPAQVRSGETGLSKRKWSAIN